MLQDRDEVRQGLRVDLVERQIGDEVMIALEDCPQRRDCFLQVRVNALRSACHARLAARVDHVEHALLAVHADPDAGLVAPLDVAPQARAVGASHERLERVAPAEPLERADRGARTAPSVALEEPEGVTAGSLREGPRARSPVELDAQRSPAHAVALRTSDVEGTTITRKKLHLVGTAGQSNANATTGLMIGLPDDRDALSYRRAADVGGIRRRSREEHTRTANGAPYGAAVSPARGVPPGGWGGLQPRAPRYVASPTCRCARHRARPAKSAASDRALPSGVRGPVLKPPWNLHRPLSSARQAQDPPARVRAPQ